MSMSVIFIASTIDATLGGIARSVPSLAGACAKSTRVILIAPKASCDTLSKVDGINKVDVRSCDGFAGVRFELQQLTSASEEISMIYHAGVWNSLNHFVARLGQRCGIPVIVSTRSMLDPWALEHRKWKKRLAWWLYAKRDLLSATAIHATAELEAGYIRDALVKRWSPFAKALEDKSPVFVVPNGVELPKESIPQIPMLRSAMQGTREGEKRSIKRLLFLSRIHEKKGVEDLIRAFGELDPYGWELVIVGNDDGGHEAVCKSLATKQLSAERIHFLGPISDVEKWDLYRSADLFVLPSYSENFGIVVGEALGMGSPVVTTTATPWREFVVAKAHASQSFGGQAQSREEEMGLFVVEPGVEALKACLKRVFDADQRELKNSAQRGAEWIRREFSWEAIGRQFLEEVGKIIPLK